MHPLLLKVCHFFFSSLPLLFILFNLIHFRQWRYHQLGSNAKEVSKWLHQFALPKNASVLDADNDHFLTADEFEDLTQMGWTGGFLFSYKNADQFKNDMERFKVFKNRPTAMIDLWDKLQPLREHTSESARKLILGIFFITLYV